MIVPNPLRVHSAAARQRSSVRPAALIAGAIALHGLLGCRTGPREYLPVKVTEPATTAPDRSPWPSQEVETEEGWPEAVEAAAKAESAEADTVPDLSESQWRAEAERVLDDWHLSAARGDRNRYLGHMTLDSVFMGTDGSERWDFATFTAYVDRHFKPQEGWTYFPFERHVHFSEGNGTAWFDEKLNSPGYGALRGTGILRREGSTWKIVHYSMTFLVPNGETAREVVRVIREGETEPVR